MQCSVLTNFSALREPNHRSFKSVFFLQICSKQDEIVHLHNKISRLKRKQ